MSEAVVAFGGSAAFRDLAGWASLEGFGDPSALRGVKRAGRERDERGAIREERIECPSRVEIESG
jgi:hypothetical protein